MSIICESGTIEDVVAIHAKILEFADPISANSIKARLAEKEALILIAKYQGQLAGYKMGYQLTKTTFYSWLGGVAVDYRRLGIATKLTQTQEKSALTHGYTHIKVKSMNRYPAMLSSLIANGYKICGYEDKGNVDESKIHWIKQL